MTLISLSIRERKSHGSEQNSAQYSSSEQRLSNMPAHPDVIRALTHLRSAGFRLVTLTNSPSSTSPTPLEKAGLSKFFEHNFSVKSVGKFKPAPEIYHLVVKELSVETSELCLVACHLWGIIGAQAAGCHAAFLTRPHNTNLLAANVPVPNFVAADLNQLAEQTILSKQI
ncbi:HAD-IA family hydrolase [Psychrobacter sp. 16-MNA-CIBAN-0192]|uniref:HAD-IA family hydrolase n=1 Tax=Psychrobacter sp. 16-MNA-CIBAN-0192 TaxID=3140448 RepID=UPI00331D43A8